MVGLQIPNLLTGVRFLDALPEREGDNVFRTLILAVSLVFCATTASAGEKVEQVQDCKFWSTKMVASRTSGAVGHVISGKLDRGSCHYDVRFALENGGLMLVTALRDYELEWAPTFRGTSGERKPAPIKPKKEPESYLGDLEFGG